MKNLSLLFVTLMAFASWYFFPSENATSYSPDSDRAEGGGARVIASASSGKSVIKSLQTPQSAPLSPGNSKQKIPYNHQELFASARRKNRNPMGRMNLGAASGELSNNVLPFSSAVAALQGYKFYQGVRAFTDESQIPEESVVISQSSKMWIAASESFKSSGVVFEGMSAPVFVSARDQSTRVPNGILNLKLKEFSSDAIASLLKDYNFSKVGEVSLVRLLEVRVPEQSDFIEILERLESDPRVESIRVGFYRTPPRLM